LNSPCQICGSSSTVVALSLASTPLEDQFLREPRHQDVYPVDLALCTSCGYTFLPYKVSPIFSYSDYLYESKLTEGLRAYYDGYAGEVCAECGLSSSSLVVDLGSNDGSMLHSFKRLGVNVLGVEPSPRLANVANSLGLSTICGFFSDEIVQEIISTHGAASLVTANYMFANVDDVVSFTKRVASLLSQDGYFIVQTGYHPAQFEKNMFDYIYHEHFSYFTVGVVDKIFKLSGLLLVDVESKSPKGGSIKLVGKVNTSVTEVNNSVHSFISDEKVRGINSLDYYRNLWARLEERKRKLNAEISVIRKKGFKVAGFGASHSTTTLIYNFELSDMLDFIVDDNPAKHNTFSPGKHIPVFEVAALVEQNIKFVVVLAWQHFETIVAKHSGLIDRGISFIRPLPDFKIISSK